MKDILGVIIFAMVSMSLLCVLFMLVDLWLGGVFSDYLTKKIRKLLYEQEEMENSRLTKIREGRDTSEIIQG